jgi:hypothetical protein
VICGVHFNCMEQVVDRLEFNERSLRNYEQGIDLKVCFCFALSYFYLFINPFCSSCLKKIFFRYNTFKYAET